MSDKLHPDYIWAWDILRAEFRPDPLPADDAERQPEPFATDLPVDQPDTLDGAHDDDER